MCFFLLHRDFWAFVFSYGEGRVWGGVKVQFCFSCANNNLFRIFDEPAGCRVIFTGRLWVWFMSLGKQIFNRLSLFFLLRFKAHDLYNLAPCRQTGRWVKGFKQKNVMKKTPKNVKRTDTTTTTIHKKKKKNRIFSIQSSKFLQNNIFKSSPIIVNYTDSSSFCRFNTTNSAILSHFEH